MLSGTPMKKHQLFHQSSHKIIPITNNPEFHVVCNSSFYFSFETLLQFDVIFCVCVVRFLFIKPKMSKNIKNISKSNTGKVKKSKRTRKETYSTYIYRVLKQVHPDTGKLSIQLN